MLTQDDPHPHAVERVEVMMAGKERQFVYDITITERDEKGVLKEIAIYREDVGLSEG